MAIQFKVLSKGEPGVVGGGVKKFYAQAEYKGHTDIDELTGFIEKTSTVSGADIRAVLYAMMDAMPTYLADGKILQLGDVGNFRVSISSEGNADETKVTADSIKKARIVFTPGKKLKDMLATVKFTKA